MRWWARVVGTNFRAGRKAAEAIRSQISNDDPPQAPESPFIPQYLYSLKDIYESAMVDSVSVFSRKTENYTSRLNVESAKGNETIQELEQELFDHLHCKARNRRWGWLRTVGLFLALAMLSMLDFGPTKLVFDSVFQYETVNPMFCYGTAEDVSADETESDGAGYQKCLIDREVILMISIFGFLVSIVLLGHFSAEQIGGEFFNASRSGLGWFMVVVTAAAIIILTLVRYNHERDVVEEKHAAYVMELKGDLMGAGRRGDADRQMELTQQLSAVTSPAGKDRWIEQYWWRIIGNAGLFTVLSILIFVAAFFVSLWRKYPDFDFFRKKRVLMHVRDATVKCISGMDAAYNRSLNQLEEYRQSAQREAGEFLQGAEKGSRKLNLDTPHLRAYMQTVSSIRAAFCRSVQVPQGLQDTRRSRWPRGEMDWGEDYKAFLENLVLYDAYEKGALDGLNVGVENPNSVFVQVSRSMYEHHGDDHPLVNDEEILKKYQAGFVEGKTVRDSALARA